MVGAVVLPLSRRLTAAERSAVIAVEEPTVDHSDPGELTQTEADLPLLGEHDMDAPCCRVLTSGSTGSPAPGELTCRPLPWRAGGSGFNTRVAPADRRLSCLPLRPSPRPSLLPPPAHS